MTKLLQSGYAQDQELEADMEAVRLSARAGFDPTAGVRLMLVPTDGFFEWEKKGKVRQPWRIGPVEDGLMATRATRCRRAVTGAEAPTMRCRL